VTWLSNEALDRLRDVATRPELPPDRYVLGEPLGRGGMGAVYSARDTVLDRDVAIKVSNAVVPDTTLDERLRAEARVLARLEHPGIVPVHDAGRLEDGRLFYVMKLVRGQTLAAARSSLTAARLRDVFERIVDAVAFAHAAGIWHGDLQPANVMIGTYGEVLVLDWGAAAIAGVAGQRIGTPGFMAPEQERGDTAALGTAADVYALGALFTWMVDGRLAGRRGPKRLRAIVAKCLASDPAARYPHAGALADDLARERDGLAVTAWRETPWDRLLRWGARYRTFILLVLAYLVMRTLFAFLQRSN
jgi:serine/threonine-protein kinase